MHIYSCTEYRSRQQDKLKYRYPRGESYLDVITRLEVGCSVYYSHHVVHSVYEIYNNHLIFLFFDILHVYCV